MGVPDKKSGIPMSVDWPLAGAVVALSIIGILNLASAGETSLFWHRQLFSLFLSIIAMAGVSSVDYRFFNRAAYIFYGALLFLLLLTVILGTFVSGSKAWIRLGILSMQPSEFMKFGAILAMAKYFHEQRVSGPYGLKELAMPMVIAALPLGMIMLQPDLGTTAMLFFVLASMILFAGVKRYLVVGTSLAGLAAIPVAWKLFAPHQKNRILAFLNPESDPMGIGYNAIQSMVAVGSGKFFGKGYRLGTQTALRYLPERHSDFAFSVLGEEWGFFGCLIVLGLFFFIIFWALRIASVARDRFGLLVGIGIASMIFWHTVVNVAMTLGAFPVIGIPLPFLSYGGSFLITTFAGIGLLMSIEGRRFMF